MCFTLGKVRLDSNKECELNTDEEFGFDVIIAGNRGVAIKLNNITEVHHLYNLDGGDERSPMTAFESDIHSTGFTVDATTLKSIEIVEATKLSEEFSEEIDLAAVKSSSDRLDDEFSMAFCKKLYKDLSEDELRYIHMRMDAALSCH